MTEDRPVGPVVPDWTPRPRPPRRPLEGRYARLEPLDPARHGDDLFAAFAEDATGAGWTYRMQAPPADRAALGAWLEEIAGGEDPAYFAYVDKATGRAGGKGAFMSINPAGGAIEIGSIILAPPLARSRAGTEALILMIDWAFAAGYRRVEWTCDPLNATSTAAAARLGFTYEATFRQAYVTKGRNRDKAIFAIVDGDWPTLRAACETWLAAENFDGDGGQKSRLSVLTAPAIHRRAEPETSARLNDLDQPIGPPVPDWSPPPRPPRRPMDGRYARLEPLDPDRHAADLFEANAGDEAMWDYMPCGPFADLAAYRAWMEAEATGDDPQFFAILDRADDKPKGVASYLRIAPEAGSIEVGHIAFSPALQRTRAGTEAMALMMANAFALGYRRYEWKCNALNAPSRRLAQRLGMSFDGVFRQALVTKGRNRDTAWYAALDGDWPALKTAFDRWLDPSNFDADGKQRQSLTALTRPHLTRSG